MNALSLKRLLSEPLLHFLLLGAAIFAVYSQMATGSNGDAGKIVVTQGQLASMWEGFTRTRQREPSSVEWQALIQDRVQQEVYYREALALGLDKDDSIIRRRLQQKLEFVSEGLEAQVEPTDAQLQTYLQSHAAAFVAEPRFSFRQLYLDPQRRGKHLARDTERLLVGLRGDAARANAASLGDPIMLEPEFNHASARDVASQFGEAFASALAKLAPGQWQGPVESSYGTHLVLLSERVGGGSAELKDVRDAVRREWVAAQEHEAAERFYQRLLQKYAVSIEAAPSEVSATFSAAVR